MMHGHPGMHGHGRHGRDGFGPHGHGKILGTTTIGERGQVVIPAEARETLDIKAGDKFVVFGDKRGNSVTFVKADVISRFAEVFMGKSEKYEAMAQDILDQIADEEDVSEGPAGEAETPATPNTETTPETD